MSEEKIEELPPIEEMNLTSIDIKPVNIDWSDLESGVDYEWFEAIECTECKQLILFNDGSEDESDHKDGCDAAFTVEGGEGPMMNYFYPLEDKPGKEAAKKIAHLPLCLLYFEEEDSWGLVLTGGGMDLSWEICEAFMCLGELPPVHFANLPMMSGRGTSEKDKWIIKGCLAAVKAMSLQMKYKEGSLTELARLSELRARKEN